MGLPFRRPFGFASLPRSEKVWFERRFGWRAWGGMAWGVSWQTWERRGKEAWKRMDSLLVENYDSSLPLTPTQAGFQLFSPLLLLPGVHKT